MLNVAAQRRNDHVLDVGDLSQGLIGPDGLAIIAHPVLHVAVVVATRLDSVEVNETFVRAFLNSGCKADCPLNVAFGSRPRVGRIIRVDDDLDHITGRDLNFIGGHNGIAVRPLTVTVNIRGEVVDDVEPVFRIHGEGQRAVFRSGVDVADLCTVGHGDVIAADNHVRTVSHLHGSLGAGLKGTIVAHRRFRKREVHGTVLGFRGVHHGEDVRESVHLERRIRSRIRIHGLTAVLHEPTVHSILKILVCAVSRHDSAVGISSLHISLCAGREIRNHTAHHTETELIGVLIGADLGLNFLSIEDLELVDLHALARADRPDLHRVDGDVAVSINAFCRDDIRQKLIALVLAGGNIAGTGRGRDIHILAALVVVDVGLTEEDRHTAGLVHGVIRINDRIRGNHDRGLKIIASRRPCTCGAGHGQSTCVVQFRNRGRPLRIVAGPILNGTADEVVLRLEAVDTGIVRRSDVDEVHIVRLNEPVDGDGARRFRDHTNAHQRNVLGRTIIFVGAGQIEHHVVVRAGVDTGGAFIACERPGVVRSKADFEPVGIAHFHFKQHVRSDRNADETLVSDHRAVRGRDLHIIACRSSRHGQNAVFQCVRCGAHIGNGIAFVQQIRFVRRKNGNRKQTADRSQHQRQAQHNAEKRFLHRVFPPYKFSL